MRQDGTTMALMCAMSKSAVVLELERLNLRLRQESVEANHSVSARRVNLPRNICMVEAIAETLNLGATRQIRYGGREAHD